jgi:hypothetical protein
MTPAYRHLNTPDFILRIMKRVSPLRVPELPRAGDTAAIL